LHIKNLEIVAYNENDLVDFKKMFASYFRGDFKIDISDESLEKLCNKISESILSGVLLLDLLKVNGRCVGFINSQVDSPKSDWNEREGWGFIRETYVEKHYRGKGLGLKLVENAESNFLKMNIKYVYLTSDDSEKFWLSCGYKLTGDISKINKDPIFVKHL